MKTFIGTKIVGGEPMNQAEAYKKGYCRENGNKEGYWVRYPDGYNSWSPKDVFEEAYRICNHMTFGYALEAARKGKRIARRGWNGEDMWVVYGKPMALPADKTMAKDLRVPEGTVCHFGATSIMKTADGTFVIGWLASETDKWAEDWFIVEDD